MDVGSNTLYVADNPNYYLDSGDRNMTPEREDYRNKCSNRESLLRAFITDEENNIRRFKNSLNNLQGMFSRSIDLIMIRHSKVRLNAYRHELQRIKGMERVVVIGDDEPSVNTLTGAEYWTCKCGTGIYETDNCCSGCGRRVLRK